VSEKGNFSENCTSTIRARRERQDARGACPWQARKGEAKPARSCNRWYRLGRVADQARILRTKNTSASREGALHSMPLTRSNEQNALLACRGQDGKFSPGRALLGSWLPRNRWVLPCSPNTDRERVGAVKANRRHGGGVIRIAARFRARPAAPTGDKRVHSPGKRSIVDRTGLRIPASCRRQGQAIGTLLR
jgi:hypothetical protein